MGSKIRIIDTSGTRIAKKPKNNESELGSGGIELNVETINESRPVGSVANIGGANTQVQFNDGDYFGGNPNFIFDKYDSNLILGNSSTIICSSLSNIIGGNSNCIYSASTSNIIGGFSNCINGQTLYVGQSNGISIVGGFQNTICGSPGASILGGGLNKMNCFSKKSSIIGGGCNSTSETLSSAIIGGYVNELENTAFSLIAGSFCSKIKCASTYSSIIGGLCNNVACGSCGSAILGGLCNNIFVDSSGSSVIGGSTNQISFGTCGSSVIGGQGNYIYLESNASTIVGGYYSCIRHSSRFNSINGGAYNSIQNCTLYSNVIGGYANIICNSQRSTIIGGECLTLSEQNDTVMVPKLNIAVLPVGDPSIPGAVYITGYTSPIQLFVSSPALPSDLRLKTILEKVGTSKDGINIYNFTYNKDKEKIIYQGVIAQELIGTKFEKALKINKGFYSVDYSKLDVEFKQI